MTMLIVATLRDGTGVHAPCGLPCACCASSLRRATAAGHGLTNVLVKHAADPTAIVPFSCLPHLLEYQAKRIPDAPAILAPRRAPLTYHRLHQHTGKIGRMLRAMGVDRHDRVAVALPNG